MNNELKWDKVLQWPQNQTTYLINISINSQQISIEVEDKFSGQIWHSIFSSAGIQDLTNKAKNFKSYTAFTKMLIYALIRQSDSPTVEILSYRQMNNKFGKPGSQSKAIKPEQSTKRFLLLTYVNKFEKIQFPLPLMPYFEASNERLKLTIERMSRQMKLLRHNRTENQIEKENALLKYENQSLKGKLKTNSRLEQSTVLQPKVEQLQKELINKEHEIQEINRKLDQSQSEKKIIVKQLQQYKSRVKQLEELNQELQNYHTDKIKIKKKMTYYEDKIEQMIIQMNDLSADLVYTRQKEKKAELKVSTLQKQLENMINNKRTIHRNVVNTFRDSFADDRRSEKSISVKSGRSNISQKSLNKTRNINKKTYNALGQNSFLNNSNSRINSNSKKQPSRKKTSVYDSDTQSSRLRRMANGRSSPYRQQAQVNNNKNKKNLHQRSKSKSRERVTSPRPSEPLQSQMMTQGYQSDSSQDERYDRIEGFFSNLKEKKGVKNSVRQKPSNPASGTKIQKRLQTLEEMIRKTAMATKLKQ